MSSNRFIKTVEPFVYFGATHYNIRRRRLIFRISNMDHIRAVAPDDKVVTSYDRANLAMYAAMLDAEEAGIDLFDAASAILGIAGSRAEIEACWRSHLKRARWIIGAGLPQAVEAFGNRPD